MKLISFRDGKSIKCGALTNNGIIDLTDEFKSLKQIIAAGSETLKKIQTSINSCNKFIPISDVKILAPIPNPGKIFGLAGNYAKHIIEAGLKLGLTASPHDTTVPRPFLMPNRKNRHTHKHPRQKTGNFLRAISLKPNCRNLFRIKFFALSPRRAGQQNLPAFGILPDAEVF